MTPVKSILTRGIINIMAIVNQIIEGKQKKSH